MCQFTRAVGSGLLTAAVLLLSVPFLAGTAAHAAVVTASFDFLPTSPLVGQLVTFDATVMGGDAPYTFRWAFGNGGLAVGSTPEVTEIYMTSGTYTVSLVVIDSVGLSSLQETEQVPVSNAPDATPLPAALPLFATGLGVMGLFGWRRKRKAQAIAA
jgi:PKD repeat protein